MKAKTAFLVALFFVASVAIAQPLVTNYIAAGTTDSALVAAVSGNQEQLYFCGFSSRKTGGSSGSTVNIYSGSDATGDLFFSFSLSGGESRSEGQWSYTLNQCLHSQGRSTISRPPALLA